jgi:hypothetical protein
MKEKIKSYSLILLGLVLTAMAISLFVAFLLFCVVFALWGFTLSAGPRKGLHGWLTAAMVLVGFCPSFMLMNVICYYGEKIGQMILYG